MELNKIILGDCLNKLKELEDNSVDSIVTDPPYELGFMGKSWDNTGIANDKNMWAECLRVLKPGGYLLAFSGTRTYHRMAVAIEDAGFEVRDMIEWVYGSGFPKSLNIGKAVDKLQGNEREIVGIDKNAERFKEYKEQDGCERKTFNDKITKGTSEWEGWGTALKPAHEPICMARKPISEKTVAENCLKYGTGGINIDESRVESNEIIETGRAGRSGASNFNASIGEEQPTHSKRFPANLIHDNSEEVRECFPDGHARGNKNIETRKGGIFGSVWNEGEESDGKPYDSGNASRFFKSIIYQAKASRGERNAGCDNLEDKPAGMAMRDDKFTREHMGNTPASEREPVKNNHPTVKPIALMEYLIKMVTPKGGIVLDPFAGSGSTLVAAKQNGFQYIGIEMTAEYIPIIEARLSAVKQQTLL